MLMSDNVKIKKRMTTERGTRWIIEVIEYSIVSTFHPQEKMSMVNGDDGASW
jgi:hypothetical protein